MDINKRIKVQGKSCVKKISKINAERKSEVTEKKESGNAELKTGVYDG